MQLDNLIQAGIVVQADASNALVKVDMLGVETDWLPMLMQANSFKKHWVGLRVGEQVVVVAGRYVLGSIYNTSQREPAGASNHTDITEYEDGTRIIYDSAVKSLNVTMAAGGTANLVASGGIHLTGDMLLDGALTVNGVTIVQNKPVARVGDHVTVSKGSSAGTYAIIDGSR